MKQIKTVISIVLVIISLDGSYAQEAIVSTGGVATGSGGSSSYSLGQVFYTSQTGADGSVVQGVQQTYEITTTVGVELAAIDLKLMAFPNPTSNYLTLKADAYQSEKLSYHLINAEGKILDSKSIETSQTSIDMHELPSGTYHLQVIDDGALIKNFRIIKN